MNLIVCLDDHGGMAFNHRRQSQDREVRRRILEICRGRRLWMNGYSARQFGPVEGQELIVSDDFLSRAEEGDCCFVEDLPLHPFEERVGKVIVFRWHRCYPADVVFDIFLNGSRWSLLSSQDFPGSSHDKIIVEEYGR